MSLSRSVELIRDCAAIQKKQVEKVKEVPTDGCYGYGYGRRDINGKANAGLTLGIIGTALGAWALFGNRRGSGLLGLAGSGMGGSNININGLEPGLGTANGITSPSAFQAWEKSCEDALALQGAIYTQALNYQNNRFADRQTLNSELFIEQKIVESAIVFWFKDADCKAENKVVEYLGEY